MSFTTIKPWIEAFRLRTLPLAVASVILGSFLAVQMNGFRWSVFILAAITTVFLQILANLANDYGDSSHGVDNESRVGPQRAVQAGAITPAAMKKAILIFVILSSIGGVSLIVVSTQGVVNRFSLLFAILGLFAIAASLKYTMGKNPYGYAGFGDLFVFIFFGLVAVGGTYFLHTLTWDSRIWLPAMAMGFLSVGVLNINNMRDHRADARFGKKTMAVLLGFSGAKIYHFFLVLAAIAAMIIYALMSDLESTIFRSYLFLIMIPIFLSHLYKVNKINNPAELDPLLRQLAVSTLLQVLLFGWSITG